MLLFGVSRLLIIDSTPKSPHAAPICRENDDLVDAPSSSSGAARSHESLCDEEHQESVAHHFKVMDGPLRVHCRPEMSPRPADGQPVHEIVGGSGAARTVPSVSKAGKYAGSIMYQEWAIVLEVVDDTKED